MKLLTKEIEKALAPIGSTDGNPNKKVIAKFFYPRGAHTWYVVEGSKMENGDWEFYGLIDDGGYFPALGYFYLSQLEGFRDNWGLGIERDMYFTPCTLEEVREKLGA